MKRRADTCLRFLELSLASLTLPTLDPLEARLLEFIARTSVTNERLSVRDLKALSEFDSPATLHARISSMRRMGWIMRSTTQDARREQIELAPAALRQFAKLAEAFSRAADGT